MVTDKGTIRTDVVVNAGGMAAPDIARLVGVTVPIIPMAHQYLVTEPFSPALEPLPTLRDPDNLVYFRTEVGGLVMGGYERDPAPFGLDGIPDGFEAQLLTEDWDRFEELMAGAVRRVPAIEHAEVKRFFNGPEAFTPDGEFILGESEVPGFWVAAGFCAHGLAGAGGIGKVMAEWIVDGEPEYDLWHMDIRRFGRHYRSQRYTLARTTEVYSQYYDIHYPGSGARGRAAAARLGGLSAAARARCRLRREVGLGACELVRAERRPAATSRCARVAGPGGTGRLRSVRSASRPAMRRRSSTSRRSRRSTCTAPVRSRSSTVSART